MRVRLLLILVLLAGLSRPLAAHSTFHKRQVTLQAVPVSTTAKFPLANFNQANSAGHLFSFNTGHQFPSSTFAARTSELLCTPLDISSNDPLRSKCMHDPSEDSKPIRGHRLSDQSVLQYLRRMIRYSREHHHREMQWYYSAGRDFAAEIVFGKLPPLQENSAGQHPSTVRTQFPAGAARPPEPWPLKTIVKSFTIPWNGHDFTYETLECAHILSAPVGWHAPVKRRRCIHCALAAAQPKKKSVASVSAAPIAKSKVVGA